jgi:oxygen-independent coproporphyrinogen-3 oxidase
VRETLGVYLHIPFCASRCSYCDFATLAGVPERIGPYLATLRQEVETWCRRRARRERADTVFFGGGTPSLLPASEVERLLETLRRSLEILPGAEITLEANPESLTQAKVEAYRGAGVTRISLGVQSFRDATLKSLERAHDAAQARLAFRLAREAGLAVSLDLIFGLPGQGLEDWREDLEEALELAPEHLSTYLLETDHETPLARDLAEGRVEAPDPDLAARQLRLARSLFSRAGYRHYEISNYARPGHASRHNLKYWSDRPFVGFGLSAASYLEGERRANLRDLDPYLEDVREGRVGGRLLEPYRPERRLQEALFTGLRRLSGVSLRRLARRYGERRLARHRPALDDLVDRGLLLRSGERLRLSARALPIANEVFVRFV